jgi:hypothetical protein
MRPRVLSARAGPLPAPGRAGALRPLSAAWPALSERARRHGGDDNREQESLHEQSVTP